MSNPIFLTLIFVSSTLLGMPISSAIQGTFYQEFSLNSTPITSAILEETADALIIKFAHLDPQALEERKIKIIKREVNVETDDKLVTKTHKHMSIELPTIGLVLDITKDRDHVRIKMTQNSEKESFIENNGYIMRTSSSSSLVVHPMQGKLDMGNALVEVDGDILTVTIPRKNKISVKNEGATEVESTAEEK